MRYLSLFGGIVSSIALMAGPALADGGCLLDTLGGEFSQPVLYSSCSPALSASSGAAQMNSLVEAQSASLIEAVLSGASKSPVGAADFGVFADARFSHTDHAGYDISGRNTEGLEISGHTPNFDSDQLSVLASLQFDLTRRLDLEKTRLFAGAFGGYAGNRVDIESQVLDIGPIPSTSADNDSGVAGLFILAAQSGSYGLLSATGFLGETDIRDFDVFFGRFSGSYSTIGVVLNGTAGHQFTLDENLTLDLRTGLTYFDFEGDSFTSSNGRDFPRTRVSGLTGNASLGLIAKVEVGEMRLKPYARGTISQKFIEKNDATDSGLSFDADDDTQLTVSGGLNALVSSSIELNAEISATFAEDAETIAGKLALKYMFQ